MTEDTTNTEQSRVAADCPNERFVINRIWAMPNKWTFTIKPIKELLARWVDIDSGYWCDPFAGENSMAQVQNDLNGKAEFNMDALEFLQSRASNEFDGVLFDPPYSITQAKECYEGRGMDLLTTKPTSMKYWGECKNEISRILKPGGKFLFTHLMKVFGFIVFPFQN